jgi:hypothetical protein
MAPILREVPVGGEQTDRIGALARPPAGVRLTPARTAGSDIQGLRVKSTAHGCFAAANPLRDFLHGEALAYVESCELLRINRMFHQDNVALLSALVNV